VLYLLKIEIIIRMKVSLITPILFIALVLSSCYNQREEFSYSTFEEKIDPEVKNQIEWKATGRGLHLSFGSKDIKYRKGKVPMLAVVKDKEINAWKGERVSFQAVLWSAFNVKQVECQWSDLISANGDTMNIDAIQTRFVRYVMSDAGFVNDESDSMEWRDSCLIPDLLDQLPAMDMAAQTVRPLWITINVPPNVSSGIYTTSLKVYSKQNPPQELRLKLNVSDNTLPKTEDWRFQTNLAISPIEIARWHKVTPWSKEHFQELNPYVDLLKQAGQKNIDATIFSEQANEKEQSLIAWSKAEDGRFIADFTNFDKWINYLMSKGIDSQIDCYAYAPLKSNFLVFNDRRSGQIVEKELDIYADKQMLIDCYKIIISHLRQKEWFDKSVFAFGNGAAEEVEFLKELINSIDDDVKLELIAHDWTSGLLKDVYAVNIPSQFSSLKDWFRLRHQQGLETSYLLDASNTYPNTYLHSPSAESAWLGWYAAAQGIDGLHIDNFNNWSANVLTDARMDLKSSGSNYLVYPDARSSIRFERIVEGIQDYEKVLILREKELSAEANGRLEQIDEVLSDFVIDRIPRENASLMVKNGQQLIVELSAN